MKKLARLMAFVMAAVLPVQSYAFECNVKINYLLVYAHGDVNVHHTGRNDFTVICNVNNTYQGVSPTTCAMWTALLLGVKKRNAMATFYWGREGSCATLGTYGDAAVPSYIGEIPGQ
ncbi:hypothetical protein [Mitsuaria sp. GD03876]|uniref:hypothetical protein n=1 Tax=Mitsuaria sp. GD03876 TaxID=2975399 RepID=UPI002448057F|nr:hypothetical protein [Mitsuaria sp. GD03876]MDH0868223.1 hypothetical protein [Mitsuaria sp. GD03876]